VVKSNLAMFALCFHLLCVIERRFNLVFTEFLVNSAYRLLLGLPDDKLTSNFDLRV
jgi:hypothetical protein